jgi:RNase P/RNase MRP subunit p29
VEENKKWFNETLAERMERSFRLKIGQTVRVEDADGRTRRGITGKIVDIKQHYIIIQFNNYKECFSRVDFLTQKKDGNRQYLVKVGKKQRKQITTEMF